MGRTHELKAIVDGFTEGQQEASVLLSGVTEEYFKYQRTVEMHREAAENPFAEQVQVDSNVRNGLGIFAALNTQTVPLVPE